MLHHLPVRITMRYIAYAVIVLLFLGQFPVYFRIYAALPRFAEYATSDDGEWLLCVMGLACSLMVPIGLGACAIRPFRRGEYGEVTFLATVAVVLTIVSIPLWLHAVQTCGLDFAELQEYLRRAAVATHYVPGRTNTVNLSLIAYLMSRLAFQTAGLLVLLFGYALLPLGVWNMVTFGMLRAAQTITQNPSR